MIEAVRGNNKKVILLRLTTARFFGCAEFLSQYPKLRESPSDAERGSGVRPNRSLFRGIARSEEVTVKIFRDVPKAISDLA